VDEVMTGVGAVESPPLVPLTVTVAAGLTAGAINCEVPSLTVLATLTMGETLEKAVVESNVRLSSPSTIAMHAASPIARCGGTCAGA
jgi:hypothetical protein